MEFSYSQTENFEMEKLSSDTGYFKKTSGDQQGVCKSHTSSYVLKSSNQPFWIQNQTSEVVKTDHKADCPIVIIIFKVWTLDSTE